MHRWLIIATVGLLVAAAPAAGQDGSVYLELMGAPTPDEIPTDGSSWHELWPEFCAVRIQQSYMDNGDGVVSPCDFIECDRISFHIEWVGPTYYIEADCSGEAGWLEPTEPQTGGDPTCEIWHWIYPEFGRESHIDAWVDDGDGILGLGDSVEIDGIWWRIEEIGLNITGTPMSPTEDTTWGKIKSFFKDVF